MIFSCACLPEYCIARGQSPCDGCRHRRLPRSLPTQFVEPPDMNDATFPAGAPLANPQHPAQATQSAQPARQRSQVRLIAACSMGNALEMFDFTVYSFFALLIGKLFFPSDSAYGSLLLAVATFGIGFVMRPLGGLVIGSYADRRGRKAAMTLTIALMVGGTLCIAFAPTYAQAGVWG